jgi:hypothetical protein
MYHFFFVESISNYLIIIIMTVETYFVNIRHHNQECATKHYEICYPSILVCCEIFIPIQCEIFIPV